MREPLVSVIIPCYNGEKYLEEFLNSLWSQDYPFVEIIFIDDGSTDDSSTIYKKFEYIMPDNWLSKYLYQSHSCQAVAVSNALNYVTGEFLMWSDADDIMLPGSINKKASYLITKPEYDMVRNNYYLLYENDDKQKLVEGYKDNKLKTENIFDGLFNGTIPCLAGTYMVRTKTLFACYPNKKIPISTEGQNLQLLLPVASKTKCAFIDEKLMIYRIHNDSHANKPRSISQQFKRAEGFYKLRKGIINYCYCDKKYYDDLASKLFEEQKRKISLSVAKNMNRQKQ